MSLSNQSSLINKFVVKFLISQNVHEDIIAAWNEKNNQKRIKSTIKKQRIAHPKGVKGKYIYFCGDERPKIIEENPDMPIEKVTCMLGSRWQSFVKSTNADDIALMEKYTELYNQDRKRYQDEKLMLDPEIPKKPKAIDTAYRAFCSEERLKKPITMINLNKKWQIVKKDTDLMNKYKEIAGKT